MDPYLASLYHPLWMLFRILFTPLLIQTVRIAPLLIFYYIWHEKVGTNSNIYAMKKGISIGVLGAGILALFSFRNVKDTDGEVARAEAGALSVETANFKKTIETAPGKFVKFHKKFKPGHQRKKIEYVHSYVEALKRF